MSPMSRLTFALTGARRFCARPCWTRGLEVAQRDALHGLNGDPHEPPGSMPAALMAAAAAGEVRNLNNALVASGCGAVLRIPARIAVMACRSPGRGPSSSAPGTETISLIS